MKRFAKIFDLPDHQVVVAKDFSDEEDEAAGDIVLTTFLDGVKVTMKHGYKSLEKRDQDFERFDSVAATGFVQGIRETFEA